MSVSYTIGEELTVGLQQLWPLVALPIAVAVLAYLVFRRTPDSRSASARSRRLLFASRVLVVVLLVGAAMGPFTVQTQETPGEPSVTLLTDESDSMAVYGNVTDDLVADIEAAGVPVTRATVGSGTDSRIGDGIAANLRENGTVVVLSDGQVTEGRPLSVAAEEARRLNATINAVELPPRRTERAVSMTGPSTTSVGIPAEFTATVDGVGAESPVEVEMRIDGEVVETQTVAPGESLSVSHTFEEIGSHRVTATISGDDIYAENDVFYRSVRVVEKPDVLYVSGGGYPLEGYLNSLYDVTNASAVPDDLDDYAAVVVQDTPANRLGNVSSLQEFVINGGGLAVVGGENAYENGGYDESPIASTLPVRVGNATGGTADIVLLVDISGSAREGQSIQKAVALDVLDQLDDENRVGVVAFSHVVYRIADLQPLSTSRERTADRIRRLQSVGGTDIANGLRGADELLGNREGTIILLSDGQTEFGPPTAVATQLGREGTRVISVGAGERVNEQTMRRIAEASGGSYFAADETNRLRLLFGGTSRRFDGENLTIVTQNTFITSGVELTANPGRANAVAVKPGADYQVATADGTPAIASWRFGLGRVVSLTAYDKDGTLGGLLEPPDSLVVTKSVNYAIGDPARTRTGVTAVGDARVGRPTEFTYRGRSRPDAEGVTLRQVSEERYRGEFTPQQQGFGELLDAEYAANYPVEYGSFGRSPELPAAVDTTDGRTFELDEGSRIAAQARQQSTRVRTVEETWDWLAVLAALLVFVTEVVARRVQVYRGRSSLESGLP
jgi:hypothetical protein